MASIYDGSIALGANSGDIAVTQNALVSVNSTGPFSISVANGTGGFVTAVIVKEAPFVASFIASSDTIQIVAPNVAIHASAY